MAPLVSEIGKRFEAANPGVHVDVQMGGSSRGIADVRDRTADIGMVSRAIGGDEKGLLAFPIAHDGVALIVHRDNPVQSLSDAQIISIYTGTTTNWRELGGDDATITVVNKAEGRATLHLFLKHFHLKNSLIRASIVIGDNEQGIKTVAGNAHAIAYVSIGTAEYDADHGVPIKTLAINGIDGTLANVRCGRFPLMRPLNLVVTDTPHGLIANFIEFARSQQMHEVVERQCFVPLPN